MEKIFFEKMPYGKFFFGKNLEIFGKILEKMPYGKIFLKILKKLFLLKKNIFDFRIFFLRFSRPTKRFPVVKIL